MPDFGGRLTELLLHPVTQEKTRVGRFVVNDVLPGDGEAVLGVLK
jgi:hypothetical protein